MRLTEARRTLLLFAYYALVFNSSPVCCIEESLCAGVSWTYSGSSTNYGLGSMGVTRFFFQPANNFWVAHHIAKTKLSEKPEDSVYMQINVISEKTATGDVKVMNGWLHLRVYRSQTPIYVMAVWAIDEDRETFGQFVPFESQKCKSWIKKDNCVPCSAVPVNAPTNPGMYVFTVKKDAAKLFDVNLLWKADTTTCSKPAKVMFLVAVNSGEWAPLSNTKFFVPEDGSRKRLGPMVYGTSLIPIRFYGPASPIFKIETLAQNCKFSKLTPVHSANAAWLSSKGLSGTTINVLDFLPDVMYKIRNIYTNKDTSEEAVPVSRQVCKAKAEGFVDFGGRCSRKVVNSNSRVYASQRNSPTCLFTRKNFHKDDFGRLKGAFQKYVNNQRMQSVQAQCTKCPSVPAANKVIDLASRNLNWIEANPYIVDGYGCHHNLTLAEYNALGLCKDSVAGRSVDTIRTWHGVSLLFCFMVLIPVSSFMARYLKGRLPFPHDDVQLPIRAWYFIHVSLVLPIICLYLTSLSSIRRQTRLLGHSLSSAATYHRNVGYVIMFLFLFECLSGFLRPINVTLRKGVIFLHWLVGYIVYYGGCMLSLELINSIMTYLIPASPIAFISHLHPKFRHPGGHVCVPFLITWVCIDLAFGIYLMVHIIRYDRHHFRRYTCTYFPVIIPLLVSNRERREHDEVKEDNTHWKAFYGYIIFCMLSFLLLLTIIAYLNTTPLQGFGPMTCTHSSTGTYASGELGKNLSTKQVSEMNRFCKA